MNRKSSVYGIWVLLYATVLLTAVASVSLWMWVRLRNYQQSVDIANAPTEAEISARAFQQWFSLQDADFWTELWFAQNPDSMDSFSQVQELFSEKLSQNAFAAASTEPTGEHTVTYHISMDNKSFAEVTMCTGQEETFPVDLKMLLSGTVQTICLPSTALLTVNGQTLYPEDAELIGCDCRGLSIENRVNDPVYICKYTITGLLTEPVIEYILPENTSLQDSDDGTQRLILTTDAAADVQNRAVDFVQKYLLYFMHGYDSPGTHLWAALSCLSYGSQAYSDLQDTYNGVLWNYSYQQIDVSKVTPGPVVLCGSNCFYLDVAYDADAVADGQHCDYADAVMRVWFLDEGEGYGIVLFDNH